LIHQKTAVACVSGFFVEERLWTCPEAWVRIGFITDIEIRLI